MKNIKFQCKTLKFGLSKFICVKTGKHRTSGNKSWDRIQNSAQQQEISINLPETRIKNILFRRENIEVQLTH
jgi:hypothetical protein